MTGEEAYRIYTIQMCRMKEQIGNIQAQPAWVYIRPEAKSAWERIAAGWNKASAAK